MGYYTQFNLSVIGDPGEEALFEEDLRAEALKYSKGEPWPELEELIKYGAAYAKLYHIDVWIETVAKKHPDLLIILEGDGESSMDIWEQRWKGDQMEFHKAAMPPFETLKTPYELTKQN